MVNKDVYICIYYRIQQTISAVESFRFVQSLWHLLMHNVKTWLRRLRAVTVCV